MREQAAQVHSRGVHRHAVVRVAQHGRQPAGTLRHNETLRLAGRHFHRHRREASSVTVLIGTGTHLTARGHHQQVLQQRHRGVVLSFTTPTGRRGSCRKQQVDAVPRLQHAGDGIDLVDGDGQCADARLDARREHELLGGRYGGRREHLARTHGQQQTLAHQGVELLRRHHRAGHVFGRYGANGHRVAAHDIALVECGIGHHHIDHLLGYGRQAFTLGLDLFIHIA